MASHDLMRAVVAFAFLSLGGCTAEGLARRDALNGLVGQSEAEIVRRLGPPADHWSDDGHRYLLYGEERFTLLSVGYPVARPQAVIGHVCETKLDLMGGRVIGWALRGDGCAR